MARSLSSWNTSQEQLEHVAEQLELVAEQLEHVVELLKHVAEQLAVKLKGAFCEELFVVVELLVTRSGSPVVVIALPKVRDYKSE